MYAQLLRVSVDRWAHQLKVNAQEAHHILQDSSHLVSGFLYSVPLALLTVFFLFGDLKHTVLYTRYYLIYLYCLSIFPAIIRLLYGSVGILSICHFLLESTLKSLIIVMFYVKDRYSIVISFRTVIKTVQVYFTDASFVHCCTFLCISFSVMSNMRSSATT